MTALAITPGDPGGIGPDLCLQAAIDGKLDGIVIADPEIIRRRADVLGLPINIKHAKDFKPNRTQGVIYVDPIASSNPANPPGISDPINAGYCLQSIEHALHGIGAGRFRALVTGPVSKATIRKGGFESFTGHTEFLRDFFGLPDVVMMLASADCRVALVTTHLPLSDIAKAITKERVEAITTIVIEAFQQVFQIPRPRIHVLGLNPHAGEDGHLGREEVEVIRPALEVLRERYPDIQLEGPFPADTAFTPEIRGQADCNIAMYHDQGLPVVKYHGFGDSVNITLGLPIVRTSVDHGTALNLAGKGVANTGGLIAAIREAKRLTKQIA